MSEGRAMRETYERYLQGEVTFDQLLEAADRVFDAFYGSTRPDEKRAEPVRLPPSKL